MQIPACAGHHIATSQGPETPHQNADREHLQMSGLNPSCQWDGGGEHWYWFHFGSRLVQMLRELSLTQVVHLKSQPACSNKTI